MFFRKSETNEKYFKGVGVGEGPDSTISYFLEVSSVGTYNSFNLPNFLIKNVAISGAVFNKRKSYSEQYLPTLYFSNLVKQLSGEPLWTCRGGRCHLPPSHGETQAEELALHRFFL